MSWHHYEKQPTVAERRAAAIKAYEKLARKDPSIEPVVIEGTKIARTFWGKAWCDNLEAYRDFEYRLPRGRSYVRHRCVLDLRVTAGQIKAKVHGSSPYSVTVGIKPYPANRWDALKARCAGRIDSLIELLKGELSEHVIHQIIDREHGLFPSPDEIEMRCSCLDWAGMCKHVAAAMYGVGHRLDAQPDLLFTLRGLNPAELIDHATKTGSLGPQDESQPTIAGDQLADVFGIDLSAPTPIVTPTASPHGKKKPAKKKAKKRTAAPKPRAKKRSKTTSSQQTKSKSGRTLVKGRKKKK